jgi:hypothetical protein
MDGKKEDQTAAKREARRAYLREWYVKNREAVNARHREQYLENHEARRAAHREWYRKNREAVNARHREQREAKRKAAEPPREGV